jgi:hypothetical protein
VPAPTMKNGPARLVQKYPCTGTWVDHKMPPPIMAMPPEPLEYQGHSAIAEFYQSRTWWGVQATKLGNQGLQVSGRGVDLGELVEHWTLLDEEREPVGA